MSCQAHAGIVLNYIHVNITLNNKIIRKQLSLYSSILD